MSKTKFQNILTDRFNFLATGLLAAAFLAIILVPQSAHASSTAVFELSPANAWVSTGAEVKVDVKVNAQVRVNAVEGTLKYPTNLFTATSVAYSDSAVTLWSETPEINTTTGTIRFSGGIINGMIGSGKIMTVTLKSLAAGTAKVVFEDSAVLAHDGKGTDVSEVAITGRYVIKTEKPTHTFLEAGDRIKLPDDSNPQTQVDTAVYYYGKDGLRYVFPNSKSYFTWYNNFNSVKTVSLEQMGTIGIGGNVTYRPGVKMIKIDSDPKVYAVGSNGELKWVKTETIAIALYGNSWNKMIDDVPDSFFSNYTIGSEIASTTSFVPVEITAAIETISEDKDLWYPVEVFINSDGSFTPASFTVGYNRTVRFMDTTSSVARVKATVGSAIAGLDSANLPAGLDYVYRLKNVGTFGFFNSNDISKTGTIVVN